MMDIKLSNEKIYMGSLLLVNAQYPIQDFEEENCYQVSGNNVDGFVVTLRRGGV